MEHLSLMDLARAGRPLPGPVVDCHMHNGRVAKFFSRFENYRDLIAQMDRIGVSCGVVSNLWNAGTHWQAHPELIRMMEKYPGRFWGYIAPDPNDSSFESVLEQYGADPRFRGIKLHPVEHGKDLMCAPYCTAYEWAGAKGVPVLIHTWGDDVLRFEEIAARYPDTILILGHSGGEESAVRQAIRLGADYENIYLDTACSYVWYGAIEAMVKGAGAEKILYGSDAYWNSMEAAVGRILFAEISDQDKRKILGENAVRIFHLKEAEK